MKRGITLLAAALVAGTVTGEAAGTATPCEGRAPAARAMASLRGALLAGRFVAYQPTSLTVADGKVTSAAADSIHDDLAILRPKFDSLITYDAIHGAESIPAIAAALGYRALVIGVWNPFDERELEAASTAARRHPKLIAGLSLGNELIFRQRSDPAALAALIKRLRLRLPELPLSTSEPFHIYERESAGELLRELDFLLVNVHPIFQPWFRAAPDGTAAQFVVNVVAQLAQHYCGPILVKETGVPTAPMSAGYSEERQAAFYLTLRQRFPATPDKAFAYFAAFDAPWRSSDATGVTGPHPEEAHWGMYDEARRGKRAARELPPLTSAPKPP
jgi:exo-beta-1,3-glucanase (GH17 family)